MPTSILATLSFKEVIQFCKNKIAIFHIIMFSLHHFTSLSRELVHFSFLHQLLHLFQTISTQTLVKRATQKISRCWTHMHLRATTGLNCFGLTMYRRFTVRTHFIFRHTLISWSQNCRTASCLFPQSLLVLLLLVH